MATKKPQKKKPKSSPKKEKDIDDLRSFPESEHHRLLGNALFKIFNKHDILPPKYTEEQIDEFMWRIDKGDSPDIKEREAKDILKELDIPATELDPALKKIRKAIDDDLKKKPASPEEQDSQDEIKNKFIFNDSLVWKDKVFVCDNLSEDLFCYGLFLPENITKRNKNGVVLGTDQINTPVIITSENKILHLAKSLHEKYRVKYSTVPGRLDLRWSLSSIRKFLDKKYDPMDFDGFELFESIVEEYKRLMYFGDERWYKVHALWDIGTYFFMLFEAYPLMEIRGMPGTAKTKIMKISRMFTFNATKIMINPSEPILFRETHSIRPTKYIDEAEKLFRFVHGQLESDNRVELINSSYSCDGAVPRMEKLANGRFISVYYDTYSPTMICSVTGLQGATEQRAIVHVTTRPPGNDNRGASAPDPHNPKTKKTRDGLYVFAMQNWKSIKEIYNKMESANLKNRDFQIWRSLLSIAKYINNSLYEEMCVFAKKQADLKSDDMISEGSLDYKLLMIMYDKLQKDEPLLIKTIRLRVDFEKLPSPKTVSLHISRLGFNDFREHSREGSLFDIPLNKFKNIVATICPSIFIQYEDYNNTQTPVKEEVVEDSPQKSLENTDNPISKIMKILNILQNELGKTIEVDILIDRCKLIGFDEDIIEDSIAKLKKAGDYFEPRSGFIQKI